MAAPLAPGMRDRCLGRRDSHADLGAVATQFSSSTGPGTSPDGAKIIVTGRNPETLATVQRELPGVILIKSDSGSLSAAQSLGGEVKKHVNLSLAKIAADRSGV